MPQLMFNLVNLNRLNIYNSQQNMVITKQGQKQIKDNSLPNLQTGLEQADYDRALQQRNQNSNRFYKGEEVKGLVNLSYFKMYGVGVYLFFSFLKHAAVFFLILSVISIAPMTLNLIKGYTFRNNAGSLSLYLTKSSLGSHKFSIMKEQNAYTLSIAYKIINATFDIVSSFIFLIFCLYWERKSKNISKHISKQIKLQSNFTVQVTQFPQSMKQKQMEQFMNRFGKLTEVVAAKDYSEQIQISKNIFQTNLQAKQLEFEDRQNERQNSNEGSKNFKKIQQLNKQLHDLYEKLENKQPRSHQITKFYVQFETPQQRDQVVRKFNLYQKPCACCKERPQELLYGGEIVKVQSCNNEPTGIFWENAHVSWRSRIPRGILQYFIIVVIIIGGFILICFLNILVPPVDEDLDTTKLQYEQVKNITNSSILQSWCNNNYVLAGAEQSPYFSTCQYYWRLYTTSVVISFSISIIIMIICELMTKIVYALASYQRYATKTDYNLAIMTNMFYINFLTNTLITFLMQADVFGLSVMKFMNTITTSQDLHNNIASMSQYQDLIPRWYKDIGYQIWFNMFTMIFLPQLTEIPTYYLSQLYTLWRGKKEKIHRKMVQALSCPEFQVQSQYANILLIIATGIIFGGGIQAMMIVVLFCLLVRYFYFKFLFIRFCKVPQIYNQALNERVISIMKGCLIARFIISVYMYGADDVFAMEKSDFMKWASSLSLPVFSSIFVVFSRVLLTWYYSMFALIFILIMIFKEPIFSGVLRCKRWKRQSMKEENDQIKVNPVNMTENQIMATNGNQSQIQQQKAKQIGDDDLSNQVQSWKSNEEQQVRSQRTLVKSYRLENNPEYQQILLIMKLRNSFEDQNKNRSLSKDKSIVVDNM